MFGRREWKTGYGRDIVVVVVDEGENEKSLHTPQIIFRFVIINIKRESKRVKKITMNNKYSNNVRYVIVQKFL